MVTLSQIYTRGGDQGRTSLGDGTRVAKHAGRVAAYGTVDEANAAIGLARLHTAGRAGRHAGPDPERPVRPRRRSVPARRRFDDGKALRMGETQVERLEREIDAMNAELQPLSSFVLPGGSAGCGLPASRPHRDPAQPNGWSASWPRPKPSIPRRSAI